MWFGIVFAILVEIVPLKMRSTTVGVFLFVMNNIGGNLPILVDPVGKALGYRESISIFYAGFYGISKYTKKSPSRIIVCKSFVFLYFRYRNRFNSLCDHHLLHGEQSRARGAIGCGITSAARSRPRQ